ncbi:hypothetical protein [Halomonas sp. BC1]|uniref:hypothetical protein n=1 Tax=Halomonas sp. BC1 TaxID=1670448 RepID=UPI0009BF817B|nr:hypothetical protein [Halomonas sp. BC1]
MLGEMGSKLRNPVLAPVLYDLNFAETKGSDIRAMCSLLHQLLGEDQLVDWSFDSGELPLFHSQEAVNTGDLGANKGDLSVNAGDLPDALALRIEELTPKTRKDKLWPVILLWLCALRPYKAEQLASLLGGRSVKSLKSTHLNVMREHEKMLAYLFAEVVNHPDQAYQTTEKGIQWLREQGIEHRGETRHG